MKTTETEKEKELLDALEDVVNQACLFDDILDSGALTANANAMRLLADYGRIKIKRECGRRVIGKWVKK